ncbi:MAG: HAMP domain-containing protein [Alphaproteobacteria bacterium]|nr:HAMP domain-containing protein [Alphaproteobacteria bacterium]
MAKKQTSVTRHAFRAILPKTLFGRSLLIIITPLIVVQVVTAYAFFNRHWDTVSYSLAQSIVGEIIYVMEDARARPENFANVSDLFDDYLNLQFSLFPGDILDVTALQKQNFGLFASRLNSSLAERVKRPFLIDTVSFKEQVVVQIQLAEGVMQVVIPQERIFSTTTYAFILWMVGSSLIIFMVASLFMRNQVRPIQRLSEVAERFGKGEDITDTLKYQGALEVKSASLAFNRMRDRIFRQMRQRTDMLSGVSHDLRTPLTRMKLQLAMMGENQDIEELKNDISDMEHMIEDYLAFARGEENEKPRKISLNKIIENIYDDYARTGFLLHYHLEGTLPLTGRPNALKRCITNLVGNARRYADNVWLQAGNRGDEVEILIDDDGPGIPTRSRKDVFKPFFRLDTSRNPKTGGTGLGLAIARDIARIHGGDISLSKSPQGGLRVQIRLPI